MRIWVARPEPGATRSAEHLARLGHDPLVASVLEVRQTGMPAPQGRFDALVVTSANAVPALVPHAGLADLPVFAVGRRSAQALREAGLTRIRESSGDAAALVRLVLGDMVAGARLLHATGEDRKAEPAAGLKQAGLAVTSWVVYAAEPVAVLPSAVADALSDGSPCRLAAALHYSRRSASVALGLAQAAGCAGAFLGLRHYCLSTDVAVPLVEAGVEAHFVPARPDEDSLLAGLADADTSSRS